MPLDRAVLLNRFVQARARTRALFDLVDEAVYHDRPIPLRNPIVFYEGHLPAFAINTLVKKGLGGPGVDGELETIFARGIDPDGANAAVARGNPVWPARQVVREYAEAADRAIADAIANADLERDDHPLLRGAQALWAILEHEEMHQETLAYMWHQIPHSRKRKPAGYVTAPARRPNRTSACPARIPAGTITMGTDVRAEAFGWDNEQPAHTVAVEAFEIDAYNVTNAEFMQFVEAGGYQDRRWWRSDDWEWVTSTPVSQPPFWEQREDGWYWRGMFELVPLPGAWPVYVTWAEAAAYARWRGRRLPTESEFHRAAYGTPDGYERRFPWGDTVVPAHAAAGKPPANCGFARWDPDPVDAHPDGASAFGVHDLVGNGWEWTSTVFGPFDGFEALPSYPEYSADFFDGNHFVLKGASPVTAEPLLRRGFRNWFRPRYGYVYAAFRCAGDA